RRPAVARSAADHCIAVAVHKPIHLDADAAGRDFAPRGEAAAGHGGATSLLGPDGRAPSKRTRGAAAHRSDSAWTRPRTDAHASEISTTTRGGAAPASRKQPRRRPYRLRRGATAPAPR